MIQNGMVLITTNPALHTTQMTTNASENATEMPPRDVVYTLDDTDSTASTSRPSAMDQAAQITPPEYTLLPESLTTELITSAGANLSAPPMSLTVPPSLPTPLIFTKESVQVYYTQVKQTAMYYGLRMPYLTEFVRKCSRCEELNKQPVQEFLEEVYFANDFDWVKYNAMVWKLTQPMQSNATLLIERLKDLFSNVLDKRLVAKYSEGTYRMPFKPGFANDFKRTLNLLEKEVQRRPNANIVETLMRLMEKIYTTAYEHHLKQKPTTLGILEPFSGDVVHFTVYKALLFSKAQQFETLANGNWPFERPAPVSSGTSKLVSKWL